MTIVTICNTVVMRCNITEKQWSSEVMVLHVLLGHPATPVASDAEYTWYTFEHVHVIRTCAIKPEIHAFALKCEAKF